jgi:hypothetical protein
MQAAIGAAIAAEEAKLMGLDDIRDGFVGTCDALRRVAYGYLYVADNLARDAVPMQEGSIGEIRGAIEGFEQWREQQFAEWRASLREYLGSLNMPLELVHAYLVQSWHGFLDSLFETMLEQHFAGRAIYDLGSMPVHFKSSEDTPETVVANIQLRALEHFCMRMSSDDKMRVVEKALNAKMPEDLAHNIRKHVIVRNVLQHNRGMLRPRDLQRLNADSLKYPCVEGDEQGDYYNPGQIRDYRMRTYRVGDTVAVDAMVLDQVYYDFVAAARTLVP